MKSAKSPGSLRIRIGGVAGSCIERHVKCMPSQILVDLRAHTYSALPREVALLGLPKTEQFLKGLRPVRGKSYARVLGELAAGNGLRLPDLKRRLAFNGANH